MYYAENRNEYDDDKYAQYFKDIEINNLDIFEWGNVLKVYKKEY